MGPGSPTGGAVRPAARRDRLPDGLLLALCLVPLVVIPSGTVVPATAGPDHPAPTESSTGGGGPTGTVWLCKPGVPADPCAADRSATAVAADGARSGVTSEVAARPGTRADCFYVYPTASSQPSANSDLRVQEIERRAAVLQASRFSRVCTVWAPMYRQATVATVAAGLRPHDVGPALRRAEAVAYASLLSAWRDFLVHHAGRRPIVLIGHSQGAMLLIRLIAHEIDPRPQRRARLVVAILAGGNLQVPSGRNVGATFRHVPLCRRAHQTGCAIAWSSFPSEPPPTALFGRPGQGISLLGGQTVSKGQQVACVDPAALGGGTGDLEPYFLAGSEPLTPPVTTPWVTYPGLYSATCRHRDGAGWLQVTDLAGGGDLRPRVGEPAGPDWGYHGADVNLVLGNLVRDVAAEEAAWAAAHR